ncbi:LLM class flavin-dependent oxidoreductase [Fictibacillus terranigra]|uniref:LLM class flavin-dependent oxidoreductase n=1 Tax=Fictibacillus terranigra TaxID=3058424 RepID=A0ABT8E8Q6_9BACL|nr:LLM class flavin-dependent oxidoreductase [Fictibacillus sp. CENA-BCM004]MDN4074289.1 LLM class flavin-dependent oxidoreductase [Fictibacillus sp. CENA-BCM004]
MISLSILDQVPVPKGRDAAEAIYQSVQLAKLAEELGYKRYWFAEHHSTKGLASSAPEILMAHAAARTHSIRLGSGAVLLPQYSPFKVAETFHQLEALYPGRIDLGVGRSPGGTKKTRLALTDSIPKSLTEFPRQLQDLFFYLTGTLPSDHPSYGITASPVVPSSPALWELGLGENSARQAADLGIGYVFGHFIHPGRGQEAFQAYYEGFKPSTLLEEPSGITAIFVICGETDEHAEELAFSQDLWLLRVEKGLDSRIPTIEEAKSYTLLPDDIEKMKANRNRMVIGSPETVRKKLMLLSEQYQTREFMVLTNVYSFEERKKSYERLARLQF